MQARAVIKPFDVVEDEQASLRARVESMMVQPLRLKRVKEALDDGVVETVARAAHAADHAVPIEDVLVARTGVLPAAIGVVQQSRVRPPRVNRLPQCLERERLL